MNLTNYKFNYSFKVNKEKPIIIFLHGFMGNIHEFDEAIKLLFNDFSYLTIDLPGHGKTQVLGDDECYTMASTAQAIISLLDKLNINQCYLIGYSMGGRLALYLTLHFPQRFIKVVLESASPGLATEIKRLARIKSDAQIIVARSAIKTNDEAKAKDAYAKLQKIAKGELAAEALYYDAYFKNKEGKFEPSNVVVQKIAQDYSHLMDLNRLLTKQLNSLMVSREKEKHQLSALKELLS